MKKYLFCVLCAAVSTFTTSVCNGKGAMPTKEMQAQIIANNREIETLKQREVQADKRIAVSEAEKRALQEKAAVQKASDKLQADSSATTKKALEASGKDTSEKAKAALEVTKEQQEALQSAESSIIAAIDVQSGETDRKIQEAKVERDKAVNARVGFEKTNAAMKQEIANREAAAKADAAKAQREREQTAHEINDRVHDAIDKPTRDVEREGKERERDLGIDHAHDA